MSQFSFNGIKVCHQIEKTNKKQKQMPNVSKKKKNIKAKYVHFFNLSKEKPIKVKMFFFSNLIKLTKNLTFLQLYKVLNQNKSLSNEEKKQINYAKSDKSLVSYKKHQDKNVNFLKSNKKLS